MNLKIWLLVASFGLVLMLFVGCGAGDLLVSVTEKRTAGEIENFGSLLEEFLSGRPEGAEGSS